MSIFNEEKYSPIKFCEQCFHEYDVSCRRCPNCRTITSFDSVNDVGRSKVTYGVYCLVFSGILLAVLLVYVWNVGLVNALNKSGTILLSFLTCALLSKGTVFYVFGNRIIRKNYLNNSENNLFFILEMVGLGACFVGALIWGYIIYQQTGH